MRAFGGCRILLVALLLSSLLGGAVLAEPLRVLATTTIVGDVVRVVAGDLVDLHVLLPVNADPHAFQPTPADAVAIADSDLIVLSGGGLETELEPLLQGATGRIVDLSERIALRTLAPAGESEDPHEEEQTYEGWDPHVWLDPTNVMIWVASLEESLSSLDAANAAAYRSRAAAYRASLGELDLWIWERVATIPHASRNLVTDHRSWGYFAARYGFRQVGAVITGFSTLSEPSAREMVQLIETIDAFDVPAIFIGALTSGALPASIAAETGTEVVRVYVGTLSSDDGPAATYLEMIRYNVSALVEALAE